MRGFRLFSIKINFFKKPWIFFSELKAFYSGWEIVSKNKSTDREVNAGVFSGQTRN